MPKNFVRKTFDQWLAHDYTRFRYPRAHRAPSRADHGSLARIRVRPANCCTWPMVTRWLSVDSGDAAIRGFEGHWWYAI